MIWERVVSQHEEGLSLLAFLRAYQPIGDSVKALKRAIDTKCCSIDGRIETISTRRLVAGERVKLEEREIDPVTVLYEDEDLLICNKPSGLLSETDFSWLTATTLILVHRLDKETSGALILAKHKKAWEAMVILFEKKQVKKEYIALVKGKMHPSSGVIDKPIGLQEKKGHLCRYGIVKGGKEALTLWRCLKSYRGISLLFCQIMTGRTHQIRVHLSSIGHPIVGDSLYGQAEHYPRLFLHAYRLQFPHPLKGDLVSITAPLPEAFKMTFPLQEGDHTTK